MMTHRTFLFAVLLAGLVACNKPERKPAPAPTPNPTPEAGYAGTASPASPVSQAPATALPEQVTAPETINLDVEDADNRAMRAEVLKRIDIMPNLGEAEKDRLYVQVERARAMGQVITIPFASGEKSVSPASAASLVKAVELPKIKKYLDDPTVVFVVLGFADKKGDPKTNQTISLQRAEGVVKILKDKAGVMNLVHAVGMGGSELFDATVLGKNRVVEVWAVLP
jgi:outer membrane protein OmpA-like peptidoglycan-associated protein